MTTTNLGSRFGSVQVFSPLECNRPPRSITFDLDFATVDVYGISLLQSIQADKIEAVHTLYVDNSRQDDDVLITMEETGQVIIAKGRTQGYYNPLMNMDGEFSAQTTGTARVVIIVVSAPVFPIIWSASR